MPQVRLLRLCPDVGTACFDIRRHARRPCCRRIQSRKHCGVSCWSCWGHLTGAQCNSRSHHCISIAGGRRNVRSMDELLTNLGNDRLPTYCHGHWRSFQGASRDPGVGHRYRRTIFDFDRWREHRSTARYVRHITSVAE